MPMSNLMVGMWALATFAAAQEQPTSLECSRLGPGWEPAVPQVVLEHKNHPLCEARIGYPLSGKYAVLPGPDELEKLESLVGSVGRYALGTDEQLTVWVVGIEDTRFDPWPKDCCGQSEYWSDHRHHEERRAILRAAHAAEYIRRRSLPANVLVWAPAHWVDPEGYKAGVVLFVTKGIDPRIAVQVKGDQGEKGDPGPPGTPGVTLVDHVLDGLPIQMSPTIGQVGMTASEPISTVRPTAKPTLGLATGSGGAKGQAMGFSLPILLPGKTDRDWVPDKLSRDDKKSMSRSAVQAAQVERQRALFRAVAHYQPCMDVAFYFPGTMSGPTQGVQFGTRVRMQLPQSEGDDSTKKCNVDLFSKPRQDALEDFEGALHDVQRTVAAEARHLSFQLRADLDRAVDVCHRAAKGRLDKLATGQAAHPFALVQACRDAFEDSNAQLAASHLPEVVKERIEGAVDDLLTDFTKPAEDAINLIVGRYATMKRASDNYLGIIGGLDGSLFPYGDLGGRPLNWRLGGAVAGGFKGTRRHPESRLLVRGEAGASFGNRDIDFNESMGPTQGRLEGVAAGGWSATSQRMVPWRALGGAAFAWTPADLAPLAVNAVASVRVDLGDLNLVSVGVRHPVWSGGALALSERGTVLSAEWDVMPRWLEQPGMR